MTHHMPRGIDLGWVAEAKHVFLIRAPARVIASYRQKMPSVTEDDIGIVRQRELYDEVSAILGERQLFWTARMCSQTPRAFCENCVKCLGCHGSTVHDSVAGGNPLERRCVGIALVWCGRGVDRFRSALDRSTFAGPSRPSAGIAHAGHYEAMAEFKLA